MQWGSIKGTNAVALAVLPPEGSAEVTEDVLAAAAAAVIADMDAAHQCLDLTPWGVSHPLLEAHLVSEARLVFPNTSLLQQGCKHIAPLREDHTVLWCKLQHLSQTRLNFSPIGTFVIPADLMYRRVTPAWRAPFTYASRGTMLISLSKMPNSTLIWATCVALRITTRQCYQPCDG